MKITTIITPIFTFVLGLAISQLTPNNQPISTNNNDTFVETKPSEVSTSVLNNTPPVTPAIEQENHLSSVDNKELEKLSAQNKKLQNKIKKLQALIKEEKDLPDTIKDKMQELAEAKMELNRAKEHNLELTKKLIQYEPELAKTAAIIDDETLKDIVPDGFNYKVLPEKVKQRVVDFHKQPKDLDVDYRLEQQITNIILSHEQANHIAIEPLTCKQKQCELYIKDLHAETHQSLRKKGYDQEQIKEYLKITLPHQSLLLNF